MTLMRAASYSSVLALIVPYAMATILPSCGNGLIDQLLASCPFIDNLEVMILHHLGTVAHLKRDLSFIW